MPTLGEFLAGTAEGLTKAVGTAGQAVGTASRIQSMLTEAEKLRRERELFPYELEATKAKTEMAKMQTEEARRTQEMLNRPIDFQPQPSPAPQAQPSPPEVVAETATKQAVSQATQQQLTKPIDVKQIEVSGVIPKQTIQTILSDPVLSKIAVQYDATGRPYTTLNNIQFLDKVLSSVSAIESGLTRKVSQATIQGLTAEKDKLYDELEKLNENPEKNKDKMQQVQNKIATINRRIDGAVQYALSTDLKLLADYTAKWDKLSVEQQKLAQQLEMKLTELGYKAQVEQVKKQAEIERLNIARERLEQAKKTFLGTPKAKMILLKDGTVVNGAMAFLQNGEKIYYDGAGNLIDPNNVYATFNENQTTDLTTAKGTLKKEGEKQTKPPKEPEMIFLNNQPTSQPKPDTNLLDSIPYTIK